MTHESFKHIEQAFGVALPDWYRQQVIDYPFSEPDDAIYHDEASIVRANKEVRRVGWAGFPWPRECFVIGDGGSFFSYFIVPSTGDKRIFVATHSPPPPYQKLDDMVHAETIERFVAETKSDAIQRAERRRNKRWWQFWI